MLTDLGKKELTKILLNTFGKCQFNNDELTKDFWVKLRISASELFSTSEGVFNPDFFWSDSTVEFLKEDKSKILNELSSIEEE